MITNSQFNKLFNYLLTFLDKFCQTLLALAIFARIAGNNLNT